MTGGRIRSQAFLKKSTGGKSPGKAKKSPKGKGKPKPKEVTGPVKVQKYAKFLKTDKNGGLVIDADAVKAAQAKVKAMPKKPVGRNKSAAKGGGGGGGGVHVAAGGSQWEDPALVEERNRLANMASQPALPQYQAPQGQQGMFNQFQQMFAPQQPQVSNQVPQMSQQAPPGMPMYGDQMYGSPPSMYGDYGYPAGVQVQPVGGGEEEWSRAPVGGVLQPHELPGSQAQAPAPQSNSGDIMSLIENLSTQEMVALACGGAGFLLFIVVIIVIVIRFKKKQQQKKLKNKDAERKEWQANNEPLPPPPGYQPSMSSKDPAHIARIQGRQLPPPPLSYTQSAGAPTGMTSGTYISTDERPSMRHKD
jgi:hypothetical protein